MQYNMVWFTTFLLISTELCSLEITNNGPITTGAQATIQARLRKKDENDASNLYHFNWIYAPLILIEKSEQQFNSVINVTGEFPGTFPVSVWVTHKNCWLCRPIARNITVLQITGKMALQPVPLQEISIYALDSIRKKASVNMASDNRVWCLALWLMVRLGGMVQSVPFEPCSGLSTSRKKVWSCPCFPASVT